MGLIFGKGSKRVIGSAKTIQLLMILLGFPYINNLFFGWKITQSLQTNGKLAGRSLTSKQRY